MAISYSGLQDTFKSLADDIITDINAGSLLLNYPPVAPTTLSNNFDQIPKGIDRLGGRVPLDAMQDSMDKGGENYQEVVSTGVIQSRVYWENRVYGTRAIEAGVKEGSDFCKVISFIADEQRLKNADNAVIDGRTCKMIKDPIPHGLFGNLYVTSYWEVMEENE